MAIIKCPECGHQVSEKAPTCPGCGVQIAGNIIQCPDCGEVYLADQTLCPGCHRPTVGQTPPVANNKVQRQAPVNNLSAEDVVDESTNKEKQTPKQKSYTALICGFIFAIVVCGVCYYYYNDAKSQKENEDYEYALVSNDPMVLQQYLNNYKDADPAHRDSIQAHLTMIHKIDKDWTNAVVSGTRDAIETYLKDYPDSPHKAEAMNKLDSMDFVVAQKGNNLETYQLYLQQHPDGKYSDQARNEVDRIKSSTVQPDEIMMVKGLFRRFFQSVNSRNEDGMLATVADKLSSFLNENGAGKSSVVEFLKRLYKEDITNMNWHILDDYTIEKNEIGQGEYEFKVKFTAEQNIERKDATKPKYNKYSISAVVNTEGKISGFNMVKLAE